MTKLRALLLSLALFLGLAIAVPAGVAHAEFATRYVQCFDGYIAVTVKWTGNLYYIYMEGAGTVTKTYTDYAYPQYPRTKNTAFYNTTYPGYNKVVVRADDVLSVYAYCVSDYGGGDF